MACHRCECADEWIVANVAENFYHSRRMEKALKGRLSSPQTAKLEEETSDGFGYVFSYSDCNSHAQPCW